jgi:transcriptional regulator with XRE-family HTH domain
MNLRAKVSRRVKSRRIELGLTQKQLADRCKLNVRYISRLENKPQNITLDILEKVAEGLECSAVELIVDGEQPITSKKNIHTLDEAIQLLSAFRSEIKSSD